MDTIPIHSVIQYIRRKSKNTAKNRVPYGVMVAVKNSDGTFNTGYSLCNKRDRFNKRRALKIAIDRAIAYEHPGFRHFDEDGNVTIPHDVNKHLPEFLARCKKYYRVDATHNLEHHS